MFQIINVDNLHSEVSDYFKNAGGFERTCWIPREHGPDISLMIEIVTKLPKTPLFPPFSSVMRNSNAHDTFSVAMDKANAITSSDKPSEPKDAKLDRLITVKIGEVTYEHSDESQFGEDID